VTRSHLLAAWKRTFDFDVTADDAPEPLDGYTSPALRVIDTIHRGKDVMNQCFRFRYERSWQEYYDRAALPSSQRAALNRHTLATIAIMIPVVLAFLMLLGTRTSLPRRSESLSRLNASRVKAGKPLLLEYIEVDCPLIPAFPAAQTIQRHGGRHGPRLHHVRGHWYAEATICFGAFPTCGAMHERARSKRER